MEEVAANINNPTAVRALLDQLRASKVWQDTLNSTTPADSPHIGSERQADPRATAPGEGHGESKAQSSDAAPSASVASLLSQLRTSEWTSAALDTSPLSNTRTTHPPSSNIHPDRPPHDLPPTKSEQRTPRPVVVTSSAHAQDIRSMSFQQALPRLTELASEPEFLTAVSRLRQEQNALEQQLWEERQALHKKHEEKVKVARTKATLIGAGLSKHEADMINDAYRRDLQKFDTERVLLAWDALIQKQQEALETLGVPTMFATTSQADCQKQRRVVQVLEGL